MKFIAGLIAVVACLVNPTASESEVHLRVHVEEKGICYELKCPSGQYCANADPHKCRAPNYSKGECFNVATGAFQKGCSPGFKCKNGKCDYA